MSSMKRALATAGGIGVLAFSLSACDNSEVVQKAVAPKDVNAQVAATPPSSPPPTVPTETPVEPLPHYNVHFDINSAELSPMAIDVLNSTIEYLRDHPAVQVTLSGYTDSSGAAEANRRLAEQRVTETAKFLEKNGVALMRVTTIAVGEGQSDLVPFGENPDTWNRRVEIEFAGPPGS